MAVYNGERYMREAVDSILAQTFPDFEFIIVDDASTDSTPAILDSYNDPRLVRLRNEDNIGLTRSLIRGLTPARGEYIARMDADDVSLPERLERQVAYLDAHPEVGLVAAPFVFMDEAGNEKTVSRPPTDRCQLRAVLVRGNQFCHGVAMFRRACLDTVGGYRDAFRYAQDYDLWLRILERYEVACLDDVLYKYRVTFNSISVTKLAEQDAYHALARECARRRQVGIPEDFKPVEKVSETTGRPIQFIDRLRARKAMAEYNMIWGRTSLARYQVPAARQELLRAIRTFPLHGRAWFYLAASLLGPSLLRRIRPLYIRFRH